MEKGKMKNYAKLGFSNEETLKVVDNLNLLLANYAVHYQKLRNFHWNVKGDDFFELHEKFEELYLETAENIDEIAERIRVFGKRPYSTLKEFLDHAEIKEVIKESTSSQMVDETLEDIRKLLSFMVDTSDEAAKSGDVGTMDLINGMIGNLEKHHWMLSTFNSKK